MSDIQVALSSEETECLVKMLEISLVSRRVEVHRTDSLAYRHDLEHELELVEAILDKLRPGAKVLSQASS
jgi:hypothetical protein